MKIAVTGANGHVGLNLCKALVNKGHQVKVLKHNNDFAIRNVKVEEVPGDIMDKESLNRLLTGTEIVFHLAARISIKGDPDGMVWKINALGTRNLVEVALEKDIRRFIHFSSIHAFQQKPQNQILDESRPLVASDGFAYDRSKAEGEKIVMKAVKEGLDAIVLNPTAIIGPEDYEPSLIGKALIELYNHKIPCLVPGGYNWVDVRDIVDAAIAAIEKGRTGEKYLLAGQWRSLKEVSYIISDTTGKKTTQLVIPFWVAKAGLPFITLYSVLAHAEPLYTSESLTIIMHGSKMISNDKARRDLSFNLRPLEDSIRDSLDWFRKNNFIK